MTPTVVCWKWTTPGYHSTFGAGAVNVLASMVRRHGLDRVLCVTNDPEGIDASVEVIHDREDFARVPSPHGSRNPSCYRRLRMFEPDAAETFGERVLSLDLDCVVTGDLMPLLDLEDDFVAWCDPNHVRQYNGSMMLLRIGSRPSVWKKFDPSASPSEALNAGFKGSDQAWISYCLPGEKTWSNEDGIYSYRTDHCERDLPLNAKVVFFHGRCDPWSPVAQQAAWVREHWQ